MTGTAKRYYRFSEAPIWELQRAYYEQEGLKAWNNDQVPQYITSNPMIAGAYADLILGFLQDRAAQGHSSEPVWIVELGAGAGRLAFQVLHELVKLRDCAGSGIPPFRYVMTDLAQRNIEAWMEHPALQPYVKGGLLDFARYDAVHDDELKLAAAGTVIQLGDLQQPLIIIANYFFDSIPQELLYVGNGQIYETDVCMEWPQRMGALKPADALKHLTLRYEHRREPLYERDDYPYRDLIDLYCERLEDSHILFPLAGLACLERLKGLSQDGFLLITADKGDHLLDNWRFADPPELIFHGSFSLTANYHAIQYWYERQGAMTLFPSQHYRNINVGCVLHAAQPQGYAHTRLAYRRSIERFGPDEFFSLKEWMDRHIDRMELPQWLSFWRLGGYDAEFFIHGAKRLSVLLTEAADEQLEDIAQGIERMWSSYYVMEQRYDLALDAGLILFEMDRYEQAKQYLEISVQEDEETVVSLVYYSLAICCFELGLEELGVHYTRKLLELEPEHEEALALLEGFDGLDSGH